MDHHALDKLTRRARKALKHATSGALKATTERSRKRHERRSREARKALLTLDYDARQWGDAPGEA